MNTPITPLRRARKARNLTLSDVCSRIPRLDTGNLSRIERGEQRPSAETAEALAKFFDNEVTEIQILYPERFTKEPPAGGNQPAAA